MEITINQEYTLDICGEAQPINSYYCILEDPMLKHKYYMQISGCGSSGFYFFTYISKKDDLTAIKVNKTFLQIKKLKKEHIETLIQLIDKNVNDNLLGSFAEAMLGS